MLFIEANSCKNTVITAITEIIKSYQSKIFRSCLATKDTVFPIKTKYFSKF